MSVEVEQLSSFQKRLQFTVPGVEVARKLEDAFRTLSHRVRIPGFRPGKVPRKMLEQRWGKQLRSEVAADLINMEFQRAASDIEFIGQPEVDKADLVENADFCFAVTVQVKPTITVEGYTGLKVDFPVVVVAETEVQSGIDRRLAGHTRLVEVEENRPVQAGDLVLAEISDGDTVIESGTMLNTAGEKYYPGVEALVIGVKKGKTGKGSVTIGVESQIAAMRGKTLDARVKVLGIQAQEVPSLSDELATELGFEGGADAMRVAIRMELETGANDAARNQARINLLQALVAKYSVEVPPALTEKNLKMLIEELGIQATYRGRDARSIRYTDAQLADLRLRATFAARAGLILEGVARAEGIAITEADLDAKYQEIADMRGQRVEAIRGYIQKDGAVGELKRHLLEERTLDWLLERSDLNMIGAGDAAGAGAPAADAPAADAKPKKAAKKAKAEPVVEAAAVEPAPVAEEAAPAEGSAKPKKAKKSKAEVE